MSDPVITISRRRNQKVLVINTDRLKPKLRLRYRVTKVLVAFFSGLDKVSSYRLIWAAAAGIGLGIGLSVTVSQQPTAVGASLFQERASTPDNGLIIPQSVQLPFAEMDISLKWDVQSGELGEHQIVVGYIEDRNEVALLRDISVGEVIKVVGSNQGLYSHRVTEIHVLPTDQVSSVLQQESNVLAIIGPNNVLQTESLVIKARPN